MKKQDLKSFRRKELIKWFVKNGFEKYRAKQIFNWIYCNGVFDFSEMKNIPGDLIQELSDKAYLENILIKDAFASEDGTVKYLMKLSDNESIECVYLPFGGKRHSVCISSQVGCAMDCKFCATGSSGFRRDLTTGEIVDQVLQIQKNISVKEFAKPCISNIVFMGMGEPLANLDNVLRAVEIFNDHQGLDIGMRRITISTSGIVPAIREIADRRLQIVLAISLNAPDNVLREQIMPISKKYPLMELIGAAHYYIEKTNRRISFEYVLIDGINDSTDMAHKTADLLQGMLCHVNLIPYNSVDDYIFKRSSNKTIKSFKDILEKRGVETTIRQERGTNIEAACGQLRRLDQER